MKTIPALLVLMFFLLGCRSAVAVENPRQRLLMDFHWKFHRGDIPGADRPDFDDGKWRSLDLPHDWSVERVPGSASLFDQSAKSGEGGGYLPGGVGWYRKGLTLPDGARGKRVFVEFEGAYMDSDVWLNGQHLGKQPYGYTTFEYELTPHLRSDGPNVLVVRANVEQPCSRWYSGAGIYRHVWLTITDPVHVAHWGAYVTTPEVTKDRASVRVRSRLANQADADRDVTIRTHIVDGFGKQVASGEASATVAAGHEHEFDQALPVGQPRRWSPTDPYLYTAVSEVWVGGKEVDRYVTPFGIRTVEFTKDRGLLLSGAPTPVKGVCNHHDQGYLGAAAFDRAIERQLEILRSMGCNAIRTSHNPPAPKLLDLCDRMGFLVMDEAFDEWKHNKTAHGYGRFFDDWSERDLRALIQRDRNHPCVILWSIGNEIPEQSDAVQGPRIARRLAAICRDADPTRPVTSACNKPAAAVRTGYAEALDVVGINYNAGIYDTLKGKYPLTASETSSTVSTRGEYNLVLKDGKAAIEPKRDAQVTSYDLYRPPWAVQVELQLKRLRDCPWVAGEFVWTGFDYLGEPTPFPWPAASSYFGIVDLCGFPKDRFFLYQSVWREQPMVHILPHWSWPGFEGQAIPVWCYSNADSVELFLNGKSLGEKRMADARPEKYAIDQSYTGSRKKPDMTTIESGWLHQEWQVPYQPGELKAVARRAGKEVARAVVATAGKPAKLFLNPDRQQIRADGQDLLYVTAVVQDAEGRVCPNASDLVRFEVMGPGRLVAVGNGDATDHDDFQARRRKAFHGYCLAIVQAGTTEGRIKMTAKAVGLQEVAAEVTLEGAKERARVP